MAGRYVFYMTALLGLALGLLQECSDLWSFLILLYRHYLPTRRLRVAICSNDFSAAPYGQDLIRMANNAISVAFTTAPVKRRHSTQILVHEPA